jgi:PAS domain S-box-containing protein
MSETTVHVLLIEDNAALADMIKEILAGSEQRFAVEAYGTLASGAQRMAKGGADVVILDLALPDSNGLDSVRRLHQTDPDIPIVVLTALENENMALHSLRDGAQDYLIKGQINRMQLIRSIRYAIERRRAEEAHLRLAAIVSSSQDAIIGMDLNGAMISWNRGAERIYGYTAEETVGQGITLLIPENENNPIAAALERLRAGQYVKDFEMAMRAKDGRRFHTAVSLSPVAKASGGLIGFSMIGRDMETRKQAEQEREHLITRLQMALNQVQTLKGLLPICASCKKIRDDHGYWTQVEEYVQARSAAEFTHGICPDCLERYKSEITSRL